jgi:hypothetical protein
MPKGIYNRTKKHADASRNNGKKQLGKAPVNAKYLTGYVQGDFKIIERITPVGEMVNGKRIIKFTCKCNNCGEIKEITSHDFSSNYKTKCTEKKRPSNWTGHNLISGSYWKRIQNQASERNIPFDYAIEDAWQLYEKQGKKCAYTGLHLDFNKKKSGNIASLDRIDNTKGYTNSNVHWVHKDVNMMKRNFSEEYFLFLCTKVAKR